MARRMPPPGKGGPREGSGRKPEWLSERCAEIVERRKLLEFLADVAEGKPIPKIMTNAQGVDVEVMVTADVKDRIKAVELLLDRGFGKSPQSVEVSGEVTGRIVLVRAEGKQ